jgi:hypothetical protein
LEERFGVGWAAPLGQKKAPGNAEGFHVGNA